MAWLPRLAKVPGGTTLLVKLLQLRFVQRLPLAFGHLAKSTIPQETVESYVRPALGVAIRRDLRSFLRSVHNKHTQAAAEVLTGFEAPVLLAWAPEDTLFPISLVERLMKILPNAQIEWVHDSRTFVPEDQPDVLADIITRFARKHAAA